MATAISEAEPGALILNEIEEGTSKFCLEVPPDALELDDDRFQFTQPLSFALTVVRSLETYHLKGRIDCLIQGECGRCLAPTSMTVQASVQILVQRREAAAEELEALEDQEMDILDPGAKQMDLKERMRDEVILELPQRLYCKEDCKGMCPTCGQDLNCGTCSCTGKPVDTRWAALSNFASKTGEEIKE